MRSILWASLLIVGLHLTLSTVLNSSLISTVHIERDAFKWDLQPPYFAGIFAATNDAISNFDEVATLLSSLSSAGFTIELVTIVGGLYGLKLLNTARFERVTFFDGNINEIWKTQEFLNYVGRRGNGPLNTCDFGKDLAKRVKANPEQFFMPMGSKGTKFSVDTDRFLFYYRGDNIKENMFTFLDPTVHRSCFTAFNITEQIIDNLQRTNNVAYVPYVPTFEAVADLVVIFMSHVPALEGKFPREAYKRLLEGPLKQKFNNSIGSFPLYSDIENDGVNKWLKDPHMWWQCAVTELLKGFSSTMQVWGRVDKHWHAKGSWADYGFTHSSYWNELKFIEKNSMDVVLLHILLGKIKKEAVNSVVVELDEFKSTIIEACRVAKHRVIVSELNKDIISEPNGMSMTPGELKIFVSGICKDFTAPQMIVMPGGWKAERNIFVVLDRG